MCVALIVCGLHTAACIVFAAAHSLLPDLSPPQRYFSNERRQNVGMSAGAVTCFCSSICPWTSTVVARHDCGHCLAFSSRSVSPRWRRCDPGRQLAAAGAVVRRSRCPWWTWTSPPQSGGPLQPAVAQLFNTLQACSRVIIYGVVCPSADCCTVRKWLMLSTFNTEDRAVCDNPSSFFPTFLRLRSEHGMLQVFSAAPRCLCFVIHNC